jgi:hypothetical protein
MKHILVLLALISLPVFATETVRYETDFGFGVTELRSYMKRHFFSSDKGAFEVFSTTKQKGLKTFCSYLTLRIDTNSNRYFNETTTNYRLNLPKNTSYEVCRHFDSKMDYIMRKVSSQNTASFEIIFGTNGVKSITMNFEGELISFPMTH